MPLGVAKTHLRAWLVAALSVLSPGAGHAYAGEPGRGALFLAAFLGVLLAWNFGSAVSAWALFGGLALAPLTALLAAADVGLRTARGRVRPHGRWRGSGAFALAVALMLAGSIGVSRLSPVLTLRVASAAMGPTLALEDSLVVDRRAFAGTLPGRGEVVAYRWPRDPSYRYIGRVIALPGDRVAIRDGRLLINGETLPQVIDASPSATEPGAALLAWAKESKTPLRLLRETLGGRSYSIARAENARSSGLQTDMEEIAIGKFEVFVLGDNRDYSNDSRYWGNVPVENLVGRVRYVYQHDARGRWINWRNREVR